MGSSLCGCTKQKGRLIVYLYCFEQAIKNLLKSNNYPKLFVPLQRKSLNKQTIMATIVLQVPDENLVSKVKQACKMLMGVSSVKVQKSTPKVDDITKTAHYKAAMDDVKNGRVSHYNSVDDLFNELGINV